MRWIVIYPVDSAIQRLNDRGQFISLRKQPTFRNAPLVSPQNDVWGTTAEIPYWWRFITQIWLVLLIGWRKFPSLQDQSEALPTDAPSIWNFCALFWDVISRRNRCWPREILAVFSDYQFGSYQTFLAIGKGATQRTPWLQLKKRRWKYISILYIAGSLLKMWWYPVCA